MNYYPKAIEVLSIFSAEEILREIAKTNPSVVVKAAENLHPKFIYNWKEHVVSLYKNEQRVPAVKLCREHTGLGLKDSLDFTKRLVKNS